MDSEMACSSSSSSSSSSSATAEASCCPICLDPLKDEAYLDRCYHAFCYKCITKWVKFVAAKDARPLSSITCPLCKAENLSIIHGFTGGSFQRHYVNQDQRKRSLLNLIFSSVYSCRSMLFIFCIAGVLLFRVLMNLGCMYTTEEKVLLLLFIRVSLLLVYVVTSVKIMCWAEIANNTFDVQRYWKSRKYLQKNMWLQNWLRREIQTLTQEEDADVIVHHIQGVVESFMARQQKESLKGTPEQKREEFRRLIFDAAGPFLLGRTERFVDELELFLASGLNIDAYDRVYMQRLREIDGEPSDQSVRSRFLYFLNEDDADTAD